MKWIGQHIWDFISRFRGEVYIENLSTTTETNVLVVDSAGKVSKNTTTVGGDITGVTAGDALTGGGTSGALTINHEDTSSQASVDNSGSTYVQDVTLDTYGHVTGLTSAAIPTLNQNTSGTAAGLSSTLAVGSGGTGTTSLADTSVLVGNGSSAVEAASYLQYVNAFNLTILKWMSDQDTGDNFTIYTTTHGATFLTTLDDDGAAAHFKVTADGDIILDSAGQIKLEPVAGNNILLDGTIAIDAGVVTGATSITSTAFAGALTGNVTGNASGTALTVTQAAQTAITSVGTLTNLQVDFINTNASTLTITDSSDTGDLFSIATTTHGATTIATVDDDAAAAHLTLDIDGDIILDSATADAYSNGIKLKVAGTEFARFNTHHNNSWI